jgi:hypothetical protein
MKLYCVSTGPEIYNQTNIEVGKVYDITDGEFKDQYRMIAIDIGNGESQEYPKTCFIPLDEWREKQLNKLGI